MNKYAQLKGFHHNRQLQFYMYAFMYVDPETIPVGNFFPIQKHLLRTTIKYQIQDQPQNVVLYLVTYVQKIRSYMGNLITQKRS